VTSVSGPRPYATLLAKGEDRRQRILSVAERLLARTGDLIAELSRVPERFERAPELIGTFTVLLVENIAPDAPLHDRMHRRYSDAVDIITDIIKRGQSDGQFRPDFDAPSKAVEILAFITGMETLWLLDRSIPLTEVFKGYAESLGRELAPRSST
jgi:hypothetical protein